MEWVCPERLGGDLNIAEAGGDDTGRQDVWLRLAAMQCYQRCVHWCNRQPDGGSRRSVMSDSVPIGAPVRCGLLSCAYSGVDELVSKVGSLG